MNGPKRIVIVDPLAEKPAESLGIPCDFCRRRPVSYFTQGEQTFPGYIADGQVITADRVCDACYFFVRFGTRNGEPRAYLTWAGDDTDTQPATLLDVEGGRRPSRRGVDVRAGAADLTLLQFTGK